MSKLSLLLLLLPYVYGALFAIDLGSEFVKVSLIKPGRVPISVVHNELSKRKTAAAVGFGDATRVYGEDALTLLNKKPNRVFLRIRDFLGRSDGDPFLKGLNGGDTSWEAAQTYVSVNDTIAFQLDDVTAVTTEEILASLFGYLKGITKEEAGEPVVDCVVAVPAFFGPVQRRRLLDAAKLADINVLSVINAHGAAALQFGIERQFESRPQRMIVYDMGANTVQASLISYSSYDAKQLGKTVAVGQFEVLDVAWNENLGGDHLDWALVRYFAARFNEKFKVDVYGSHRSVWKLKKAVSKAKHVLSANTEAHLHVEELYEGHDYNDKITRSDFERLNAEFFVKAVEPLRRLMERNAVNVSALLAVELIGGGTRVPKLQSVLSTTLGGRSLDKHLDGDEAVVMGAGLVAANLSTIFRLRQFGYIDGAVYPMELHILRPDDSKLESDAPLFNPKPLLPYMKRLPAKRSLALFNLSDVDLFKFQLKFNTSNGRPLPPGAESDLYASYEVSGIGKSVEKHGSGGKVVLHFRAKDDGLVEVDRAEYVVETTEMTDPPPTASNTTSPVDNISTPEAAEKDVQSSSAPEGNKTNDDTVPTEQRTDKASVDDKESTEGTGSNTSRPVPSPVPKKVIKKTPLTVSDPVFRQPSMTIQQMKTSKSVLRKYVKGEALKKKTEKAKNTLETYIVEAQNGLKETLEVIDVTTTEQRETFMTQLTSAEDWLYMDGADAKAEVFDQKLKDLQKIGEPIFMRAAESINRPMALEKSKKTIDIIEKALNALPEIKPWLLDDLVELANATADLRGWLREKEEAQSQLEPYETPLFTSIDVMNEIAKVEKIMNRVSNRKPPKMKSPPMNGTSDNETHTTEGQKVGEGEKASEGETESEGGTEEATVKKEDATVEGHLKDGKESKEEQKEDVHIELR